MDVIIAMGEGLAILFEKTISGNDSWHFVLSAAILLVGFLVLEVLWRRVLRRIEQIQEVKLVKRWRAYLSSFAPAIRLLVTVFLIHLAQMPLELPEGITFLLGGLKSFLLAVAIILFVFQVIQALDLFFQTTVLRVVGDESEEAIPEVDASTERSLRNLKSILRIAGIVGASIFFVFTQKQFFPEWIWDSSWWRYGALAAVYAVIFVGGRMFLDFLRTLTSSLKDAADQVQLGLVIQSSLWPIRLLLLAIALYMTRELMVFPEGLDAFIEPTIGVLTALVFLVFFYKLLDVVEFELIRFVKRDDNELDMNFVQMARIILKVLVVTFGFIYLTQAATGQPMTSLLAGLGIGGLAVALAAQDPLKNLFGSIVLMMDKPFVVGDWIQVDGNHVIVEEIGFRTTKVRAFTGQLLYIPNQHMAGITIENMKKRPFVRRNMNITITYDTPPDKVEKAVQLIRDILTDRPELHPDYPVRVHFNEFNDASLNIIVSYWYKENDHWAAIEFGERVNLGIMRAFEKEGIEFAFPTTTTYLAQDDRRPLSIALKDGGRPPEEDSLKRDGEEQTGRGDS